MDFPDLSTIHTVRAREKWVGQLDLLIASQFSGDGKNAEQVKELRALRERAVKLPVVRLTLAFEPSESFTEKIYQTLSNTRGSDAFLLEFDTDPSIIAGVVISDQGRVEDKSLVAKLTSTLLPLSHEHV